MVIGFFLYVLVIFLCTLSNVLSLWQVEQRSLRFTNFDPCDEVLSLFLGSVFFFKTILTSFKCEVQ